jgi:hypothetical protein
VATAVIRCPKCGYPCLLENEKNQQYCCESCKTTFRFVETTKKLKQETKTANCPECGNPIKANSAYTCSECGKTNLCNNCVDEKATKIICKDCLKKSESDCGICGKEAVHRCVVCGVRRCKKDYHNFNVEIKEYSRVLDMKTGRYYSLYCPSCKSEICEECYKKKEGFLKGGLSFYCKKCGSKLKLTAPHTNPLSPVT